MWQIRNFTPFAADRTWTRGTDGSEIWLVAVKCTFAVNPDGSTEVASPQPPVVLAPEHVDPVQPERSSLKYDTDLVRNKTTTDVVLLGHAYAPHRQPVTELEVTFRVGPVRKRLRVVGDRVWHDGSISTPQPFVMMPIVYERAYGGVDPETRNTQLPQWDGRNPVGRGFALSSSGVEGRSLPNIERPETPIRRWNDRPEPAGFAPICSHWASRAQFAGTYDSRWQQDRFPLLPENFDDRYYQSAPPDQQAPKFLTGGEPVTLINLTPNGELHFTVPRVYLGFETIFFTGEREIHAKPLLHTIIVEPDFPRVSLVWHTALQCHPKVYKLKETRIIEKQLLQTDDQDESLAEEEA